MKTFFAIPLAVLLGLASPTVRAAVFSFDGEIERAPEGYQDYHTLDFIFIETLSPGILTVTGSAGTLLDFNFGLYVKGAVVDGRQRLNLASGLTFIPLSATATQIQCDAQVGSYIIGVDPSASDWDTMEGIVPYFHSDGEPEFAHGTYHLAITGDFTVTKIQQGLLPTSVPEPSSLALVAIGLGGLTWRRIKQQRAHPASHFAGRVA